MTRESATSTSSKSSRYSWRALLTTHAFDLLDDLAIFSRRSLSSGVIRIARVSLASIIHLPVAIQCNTMQLYACLLYTSDAADDLLCVDLGGRRIIKKKK